MPTRRPRRSRRCCSETDRAILVIRDAETVVLVPPGGSPQKCPDKCANLVPHPGSLEGDDPREEKDVQDVYIEEMRVDAKANALILRDERGRRFSVNLTDRSVTQKR